MVKLLKVLAAILVMVFALWLCQLAAARAGTDTSRYGNDFTVFYTAAQQLIKSGDPYHHPLAEHTPYLYPPLFALLVAPLTLLPLPAAALLWSIINLAAAAALIALLARLAARRPAERAIIALLLAIMLSRIIIDNLLWGQVNIIIAYLIALWLALRAAGRTTAATLLLALAISIKVTPALLALYLLIKNRAELVRLLGWLAVLNSFSLLPLGTRAPMLIAGWFSRTILNGEGFNWAYAGNQSLRGALLRLLSPAHTEASFYPSAAIIDLGRPAAAAIFFLIVLALLGWFVWQIKDRGNEVEPLQAAAALCALSLLISNLSWKGHFILLAFPWAILLSQACKDHPIARRSSLLLICSFILCNLTSAQLIGARAQQWTEVYSCYCIAALIAFIGLLCDRENKLESEEEKMVSI